MGDVVVTRADREAAAKLLEGSSPYLEEADSRLWVESGEDFFDDVPEGDAELYYATAATIARVRIAAEQRTREECARALELFCAGIAGEQQALRDGGGVFSEAEADALDDVETRLRALAERMRKGDG